MEEYDQIDEAMLPLNEHVRELLNLDGFIGDDVEGIEMEIFEATVESPIQLDILVDDEGKITFGSSPPLYYVPTTIMPVFHQMKILMKKSTE